MQQLQYFITDAFDLFTEYWYLVSRNTMAHLGLFMLVLLLLFFIRHRKNYNKIRAAVEAVPFVVGGWGTRGKSGTERKKVAFFEALGLSVLSKTTGCEAMFLHTVPGQKSAELYLFRPYDKATIWEQGQVIEIAARTNAQVFCWECMALNPEYVRILQQEWMRDTVATVTNTYPDHEDIQGPAGRDLPYVMNHFIPYNGYVLTAEEQMYPVLAEEAERKNSDITQVTWRDAFYMTPDVMDRYPYKVHPENLALVLKMGEQLGVEPDFGLKEMADKIVADIGVLKVYPEGIVLGRKLLFINGCSANERRGFLSNWVRMEFQKHDQQTDPQNWIVTVVNNRADRIPRSKVFADILVMDVACHRNVLIGTNLGGLKGYIAESLGPRVDSIALPLNESGFLGEKEIDRYLRELLADLKWECFDLADVRNHLRLMFEGLGGEPSLAWKLAEEYDGGEVAPIFKNPLTVQEIEPRVIDDFIKWGELFAKRSREFFDLRDQLGTEVKAGRIEQANEKIRKVFLDGFMERLLVIEDPGVSGDQIVQYIAEQVPPGFLTRLMGTQNIKGTGLDFVYRWLAHEKTVETALDLKSPIEQRREEALEFFATYKEYGLLNAQFTLDAMAQAKGSDLFDSLQAQRRIDQIVKHIESSRVKTGDVAVSESGSSAGRRRFLLMALEAFVETTASKRRMKTAKETYDLLCRGLISHERAAIILRKITKEQKGGWLPDRIARWEKKRIRGESAAGSDSEKAADKEM
jgi:gamma-polyglutamate synthase